MSRSCSTAIRNSPRAPGPTARHFLGLAPPPPAAVAPPNPGRWPGAAARRSRHDAMLAGEAGADYVMFGDPDRRGGRPPFEEVLERLEGGGGLVEIPFVADSPNTR